MNQNHFNGHAYYGQLLSVHQAIDMYNNGDSVLETNNMQGNEGRKFLEKLMTVGEVFLDFDDEMVRADTVFFVMSDDISKDQMIDLLVDIASARPDEISNINDTIRIWWD